MFKRGDYVVYRGSVWKIRTVRYYNYPALNPKMIKHSYYDLIRFRGWTQHVYYKDWKKLRKANKKDMKKWKKDIDRYYLMKFVEC